VQEQSADQTGLLVCGFSPDGSHIVAGSNDCHIYAWFWDIASAADKGKAAAKQGFYNVVSEEDAARNLAPAAAVDLEAGDWPEPQETCRLGGHVNDVLLLQFSHDGHSIATGSKDGTMRVSTPFPLLLPSISPFPAPIATATLCHSVLDSL
jgi:WD40 repeat protein